MSESEEEAIIEGQTDLAMLQEKALDHFYDGQELAGDGDEAGGRAQLDKAVRICERVAAIGWTAGSVEQLGIGPPFGLIGSAAMNCIGEQELDQAVKHHCPLGGAVLSAEVLRPAKAAFTRAVSFWPANPSAKINLAHVAREEGRPAAAAEFLDCVAALLPPGLLDAGTAAGGGGVSRRRDCHSAAPPSTFSRCFSSDG